MMVTVAALLPFAAASVELDTEFGDPLPTSLVATDVIVVGLPPAVRVLMIVTVETLPPPFPPEPTFKVRSVAVGSALPAPV